MFQQFGSLKSYQKNSDLQHFERMRDIIENEWTTLAT